MPGLKSILELPLTLRQRKLVSTRVPMAKQAFVDAVATTDVGKSAAALLWDKLCKLRVCDDLTPYPSDDLLKTFGLAEEDLDTDIIIDIARTLNRAVPNQATVDSVGAVTTPSDIVRLIEATRAL